MATANVITLGEVWKDIPGFEGIYQASNHGRIWIYPRTIPHNTRKGYTRTLPSKIKLSHYDKKGYELIILSKDGIDKNHLVHRLVALTFLGPDNGQTVNHKDGNKSNNMLENLEYMTINDNLKHAIRTGLMTNHKRTKPCIFSDEQVVEMRKLFDNGVDYISIAKRYKHNTHRIRLICLRKAYCWVK